MNLLQELQALVKHAKIQADIDHQVSVTEEIEVVLKMLRDAPLKAVDGGMYEETAAWFREQGISVLQLSPNYYRISIPSEETP